MRALGREYYAPHNARGGAAAHHPSCRGGRPAPAAPAAAPAGNCHWHCHCQWQWQACQWHWLSYFVGQPLGLISRILFAQAEQGDNAMSLSATRLVFLQACPLFRQDVRVRFFSGRTPLIAFRYGQRAGAVPPPPPLPRAPASASSSSSSSVAAPSPASISVPAVFGDYNAFLAARAPSKAGALPFLSTPSNYGRVAISDAEASAISSGGAY